MNELGSPIFTRSQINLLRFPLVLGEDYICQTLTSQCLKAVCQPKLETVPFGLMIGGMIRRTYPDHTLAIG